MAILRLTDAVSDEFECEVLKPDAPKDHLWLVRPCERYKELYKSCKSISSRIHQYYVFGEKIDCSIYYDNYNACMKFRKTKDLSLLDPIIDYEQNRIKTRLLTVTQNKAWESRDKPPEDFNAPLPEFISKRQQRSLFNKINSK